MINVHIKSIVALTSVALSLATPAFATAITNQDAKEHTVTVDRGVKESQQKIAAGTTAQVDCPGGCGFTVEGSGYGREPTNEDKLVINKDGMLDYADHAR